MDLTVLGGCGAWPAAGQACSGYLVEEGGYHLLVDPGYATLPRLLTRLAAHEVDAVVITHSHPDHCADLNPLLRARVLSDQDAGPLPVLAPPGALDAVLALDSVRGLSTALEHVPLADGKSVNLGPLSLTAAALPHHVTNMGVRISSGPAALAYTGDSGPDQAVVALAKDVDVLLAEATYPDGVPDGDSGLLCDARQAAAQGLSARAGLTLLTHWWPTATPQAFGSALRQVDADRARLARPGEVVRVGPGRPPTAAR
jgi:ribonuclease BN (tRNA processing enzyme)